MNSLSIAAHRTALLASQRARPYYFARGCFMSTQTKEPAHPDKVAPDLRVMAGYMEYLDTMIAKTKKIEESMEDLKETYAKKRDIIVTWTDIPDIDAFFEQSGEQKAEISARLAELKTIMADAKDAFAVDGPHEAFAVDAPDGLPDALVFEEMQEIKHIIEEEAEIEAQIAKDDADYQTDAKEAFAVDGPHEAFAVDAPDGLPDALVFEEMQEIKHIIEEEAEIEAQIAKDDADYQHKIEDEIEKTP